MKLLHTTILTIITFLSPFVCAEEDTLYLHCFTQTTGMQVVYDDSPRDLTKETPPTKLVTLRVSVDKAFEALIGSGYHQLEGIVTMKDGELYITLSGGFRSGFAFSGNVEMEKVFDPKITWFSGAANTPRCVLSKHKEIQPFLKAQATIDAERLRQALELSKKNIESYKKK